MEREAGEGFRRGFGVSVQTGEAEGRSIEVFMAEQI